MRLKLSHNDTCCYILKLNSALLATVHDDSPFYIKGGLLPSKNDKSLTVSKSVYSTLPALSSP